MLPADGGHQPRLELLGPPLAVIPVAVVAARLGVLAASQDAGDDDPGHGVMVACVNKKAIDFLFTPGHLLFT